MNSYQIADELYAQIYDKTRAVYDPELFDAISKMTDKQFAEMFHYFESRYGSNLFNFMENYFDENHNDVYLKQKIQTRMLKLKLYQY